MKNVIRQHWNRTSFTVVLTALFSLNLLSACVTPPISGQKILARDGAPDDLFGFSVAIWRDTALIGALRDDDSLIGADAGSAYVFTRSDNGWKQHAKLTAFDGSPNDTFGGNLTLFGDIAVIGASRRDDKGEDSGSAYVFVRSGTAWTQQAKITASDGAQGDGFGQSVVLLGDTLVVGAPRDDDQGEDSGSAYVFTRTGSSWRQQAKLTAADGAAGDLFGISLAISGDTILVGADLNDEIDNNAGAAYVYTRSGNRWTQQAKLTAADGGDTDIFGVRVALSGDTALISARRDDTALGVDAGSAYIFTRTGASWRQQVKLTAPDGDADDRFGRSVALEGDIAVIGAMFQDDKGDNSGAAYVFTRSGKIWSQKDKLLAMDGAANDRFGWSVALSGETAIIAATGVDDNGAESGAAYIYDIGQE